MRCLSKGDLDHYFFNSPPLAFANLENHVVTTAEYTIGKTTGTKTSGTLDHPGPVPARGRALAGYENTTGTVRYQASKVEIFAESKIRNLQK